MKKSTIILASAVVLSAGTTLADQPSCNPCAVNQSNQNTMQTQPKVNPCAVVNPSDPEEKPRSCNPCVIAHPCEPVATCMPRGQ